MALNRFETSRTQGVADLLVALTAGDGSASHPYVSSAALNRGAGATRNLADAAHYLSVLHGRYPGLIDFAADRADHPAAQGWLQTAAEAFGHERAYLAKIVVAAGPLPSTLGQAESEAAVLGQRHALEMLAQSDRVGCAIGATIALLLDWRAIRKILDTAAERLGIDIAEDRLPADSETLTVVLAVADSLPLERALAFGAQQILIQHRGLWDLLETRELARRDG